MPVIDTGLTSKGLKAEFFQRLGELGSQTYWEQLATRIPSQTDTERYRFLGHVPQMREWGTGRKAKGLGVESFNVENMKYEATIEVDRDEISDDQTGQIMIRARELADRAASHKDYLIAQLLINGATAGFTSYDGVTFFNAAHVSGESGSQDNTLTGAIVDKDSPTAAEMRGALSSGISRLLSFADDQGQPMALSASGLVLVVPPSMLIAASEAVNATIVAGGGTNILAGAAKLIAFPWLTATDEFFILKTDVSVRPFILQDREPLEWRALTEDSETGFLREVFLFGVRARYRMSYGYWQLALKYTFTTA